MADHEIIAHGAEAVAFCKRVAAGDFAEVIDGRWLLCHNPSYQPDNGEDPFVLFDPFAMDSDG